MFNNNHFRDNLNRHNKYHYGTDNIYYGGLLPINKFYYRNIHQNIKIYSINYNILIPITNKKSLLKLIF